MKKFKINTKTMLYILVAIVTATVLVFIFLKIMINDSNDQTTSNVNSVCSENILVEGRNILRNDNSASNFSALTAKIKNLKDYHKDPNCLYLIVERNIKIGDAAEAEAEVNRLEKVYDPDTGFASALGTTETIEDLKKRIELIDEVQFIDTFHGPTGDN